MAATQRSIRRSGKGGAVRVGFHLEPGMKVGLFGGSFNPAHEGHSHVAETALVRLGLHKVIWLVSPQNPLKSYHETAPLAERMVGAKRLARGPSMIVSDAETRLGSQYTLDTVRALKAGFPGVKFVWIMGADSFATLHRWRDWVDLMREIPMAVISRPWAAMRSRFSPAARRFAFARWPAARALGLANASPPAWVYLTGPFNFASSTALRERMRRNSPDAGKTAP